MKIFLIDEEKEKILVKSKQEFDSNIQVNKFRLEKENLFVERTIFSVRSRTWLNFDHVSVLQRRTIFIRGILSARAKSSSISIREIENARRESARRKMVHPCETGRTVGFVFESVDRIHPKPTNKSRTREIYRNRSARNFQKGFLIVVRSTRKRKASFVQLLNTSSVYTWPRDIQNGIFELIETLIDLVSIRIEWAPVPVSLLGILSLVKVENPFGRKKRTKTGFFVSQKIFDSTSAFGKRHRTKAFPSQRSYSLDDHEFLKQSDPTERFGWLKSFLQRVSRVFRAGDKFSKAFSSVCVAKRPDESAKLVRSRRFDRFEEKRDGKSKNLRRSWKTLLLFKEFEILLRVFMNCSDCVNDEQFRRIFEVPVHRVSNFLKQQKVSDEVKTKRKRKFVHFFQIFQDAKTRRNFDRNLQNLSD